MNGIRTHDLCDIDAALFHLFTSYLRLRVYYELASDQLPVGVVAQLVRALHRYRRGHGFEPRSSLNFISGFIFSTAEVDYILNLLAHYVMYLSM